MLNCHQATQLMSRAQDEKLTLAQRSQLKMHLVMCSACSQFSRQIGSLRDISRVYANPDEHDESVKSSDSQKPGDNETKPDKK